MPAIVVTGGQWGDEGKGKIVDMVAQDAAMIVRYSGGDNAGHTVINSQGEFKLHIVPSGIFSPKAVCIIGNGVAINPAVLIGEINDLKSHGVDTSRLYISDRAHIIMPYHIMLDGAEESLRGGKSLGTTRKGIGPVFTDKTARTGIRMGDLLHPDCLRERLTAVLEYKNILLTRVFNQKALSLEDLYNQCLEYVKRLGHSIREADTMIDEALRQGQLVVLEGAQGALLDPDFGTYPYTTSSSPLAGGACIGSGVGPTCINHVIGIYKAYITRVGNGPMPTEMPQDTGNFVRERAHEYGATTGRARRCGWFDAVAGAYTVRINGVTNIALTRLDILDTMPKLKICVGYRLDGKTINTVPAVATILSKCQPIYEEVDGWESPTGDIREYRQLPLAARRYIKRIEELTHCPVSVVSVGADREQTIIRHKVW